MLKIRSINDDLPLDDAPYVVIPLAEGEMRLPRHAAIALYWHLHHWIERTDERQRVKASAELQARKDENDALALWLLDQYRKVFPTRNEVRSIDRQRGAMHVVARTNGRSIGEVEALLGLARALEKTHGHSELIEQMDRHPEITGYRPPHKKRPPNNR